MDRPYAKAVAPPGRAATLRAAHLRLAPASLYGRFVSARAALARVAARPSGRRLAVLGVVATLDALAHARAAWPHGAGPLVLGAVLVLVLTTDAR